MKLIKILPLIILFLVLFPARSFADMPKIEAGEQYYDIFKGYFVLKDNVRVEMHNHGVTAIITADGAKVSVVSQKCWAEGNVRLTHDEDTFSCDNAYLQWKTKTAEVVGNVNFKSKKILSVTSDTAIFNWSEKIVDFYGNVKVKGEKNLQLEEGLKIKKKVTYSHVRYHVKENKILLLEVDSEVPNIKIPNPDSDENSDKDISTNNTKNPDNKSEAEINE